MRVLRTTCKETALAAIGNSQSAQPLISIDLVRDRLMSATLRPTKFLSIDSLVCVASVLCPLRLALAHRTEHRFGPAGRNSISEAIMVTKRTVAITILSLVVAFAIAPASAQNPPPPVVSPNPIVGAPPDPPPPMVSPDPIVDIPITNFDPSLFFANYSWRSFIALNWPAKAGAANRGQPDRTKAFSDVSGPRVWSTWKSRYEIFQPNGEIPAPWASYDGKNPCGDGFSNEVVTLSSFTAFGDFNQATFNLERLGNPLVAQTKLYARYQVRVNQQEFDSIVGHKWFLASNLPTANAPVPFNVGSIEVKAAWRILTSADTPAIRARYYIIPNAQVFDVASAKCTTQDVALVGFHIVAKTPSRPQWIWSSFEHVDNVPGITTEPKPPAGIPLSFNDPNKPQALDPRQRPPAISPTNPPLASPTAMQVIRKQALSPASMSMNNIYWNLPEIKGTVWQNYMLVMTQWPTQPLPEAPSNSGDPFPTSGSTLSNTTMETYFQDEGTSCLECHQLSNDEGRDFVMFVTFDAFRSGVPSPSDPFSGRVAGALATEPGRALGDDPMIRSLVNFFERTKDK